MRISRQLLGALAVVAVAAAFLLTKLACSHSKPPPPAPPSPDPGSGEGSAVTRIAPGAAGELQSLGAPIRSARTWTTALAPNKRGGWNFITQAYELHAETPTEFVVVDLDTGKTTVTEGAPKVFTNQKYKFSNQLRAANGRIFFPESNVSMAYYDPADEKVHELGRLIEPPGANKIFYSAVFGPDGMLYLGTESNKLPTIVQLDPVSLKARVLGEVGKDRISFSYAYDLAIDPPWVYVAVGQNPWELAALNITTGESKILAKRDSNAPWIKVQLHAEGVSATLITGVKTQQSTQDKVWCVDGKTLPLDEHADAARLPFKARSVRGTSGELVNAPELNLASISPGADGNGLIRWRPRAAGAAWKETRFAIKYTSPIDIESLIALPDGSLLGNAVQYHGFFRLDPKDGTTESFGRHGPSRPVHATANGIVYISGYPNGVLYAYDPKKPWQSTGRDKDDKSDPDANPAWLGLFKEAGAHYASALVVAKNGRLYYSGRRERDGLGGAVGYYDTAAKRFAGHHDNLGFLDPQGLAVLDGIHRVVYSGKLRSDPAQTSAMPHEAELVIFDEELAEVGRAMVKPGLASTGQVFTTRDPNIVVGVIASEGAVYRFDVTHKKLLAWQTVTGTIGETNQRASDQSIWMAVDNSLVMLDPETLAQTVVGKPDLLPKGAHNLEWLGNDLYLSAKDELSRIPSVGTH